MTAEWIQLTPDKPDRETMQRVAKALADGALVAFPTETVYGLAASAERGESVERLRAVKGRAAEQPFTVHIGRREDWTEYVPDPSPIARRLIRRGWPGPLTLVFPVPDAQATRIAPRLSDAGREAIYSKKSVGIRCPDHPVAERLLVECGVSVIASSANVTGAPPATDAEEIGRTLSDRVDYILDAGATRFQKGSTIVSLNGQGFDILRVGIWDERTIRQFATLSILFVCTGNTCRSPMAEGLFRKFAAEKLGCGMEELADRGVIVRSAGTGAVGGGRASPEAVEVCQREGVDITSHTTRGLSLEVIQSSDYIYTMSRHHAQTVRQLAPGSADKVTTLHPTDEIADPMGGSQEDYDRAAAKITEALRLRLDEVPL